MRSDTVTKGKQQAPHRSLFNALGMTQEEMDRPLVGIVSSYNEIVPGHMNLDKIVNAVKQGVAMAGGTPVSYTHLDVYKRQCPSSVADRDYMENSVNRTTRWLKRCKAEMDRLNSLPNTINKHQMLFGINQGGVYEDIRVRHAQEISELDLDGYAVGGLAVGESHEEMYRICLLYTSRCV